MATSARIALCLGTLLLPGVGRLRAEEVIAVLSSDLAPYRDAYAGFTAAFGRTVPQVQAADAASAVGDRTRLVVAFGGKAALQPYPAATRLVYCMAPGTVVDAASGGGIHVEVQMLPPPEVFIDKLRLLQPGVRRLGVLWSSPSLEPQVQELAVQARNHGLTLQLLHVADAAKLPERLREAAAARVDALYLVHDPRLVTEATFATLKEFCWANQVPFYAPNPGLVEKGATASIAASFRAIGAAAAVAARSVLTPAATSARVYSEPCEVVVSRTAAAKTGLRILETTLRQVDKVVP